MLKLNTSSTECICWMIETRCSLALSLPLLTSTSWPFLYQRLLLFLQLLTASLALSSLSCCHHTDTRATEKTHTKKTHWRRSINPQLTLWNHYVVFFGRTSGFFRAKADEANDGEGSSLLRWFDVSIFKEYKGYFLNQSTNCLFYKSIRKPWKMYFFVNLQSKIQSELIYYNVRQREAANSHVWQKWQVNRLFKLLQTQFLSMK